MRLSFITDEATEEPTAFLALARQFALEAVELRTVRGVHVAALDPTSRRELLGRLRDAGTEVCCIDSPVFKCDIDVSLAQQLDVLRRNMDVAAYFGCPYVRIFSFSRRADRERHQERIVDALGQAADVARSAGFRLLIENGKETMHSTGAELVDLLCALDPAVYSALWDPGSCVYGGTDPNPVENGYPLVEPYVRHVHIKDPCVYRGAKPTFLEHGARHLELARQVSALRESGYSGYLALETHWRPDYSGGDDFPVSAYAATERSLTTLQGLLRSH